MIFSRTTAYAIRALVDLAELPPGRSALARELAAREGIPSYFLAKILQQLARQGILRSSKGPAGGFRLRVPPAQLRLLDIATAIDGASAYEGCVGGLPECSDAVACPMHDSWKVLRSRIMDYLERNSIASLVKARRANPKMGRRRKRRKSARP